MEDFDFIYNIIYIFFGIVALFLALELTFRKKERVAVSRFFLLVFFTILAFLFGFRDLEVGEDTSMYDGMFDAYEKIDFGTDFFVFFLFKVIHYFSDNSQFFFLLMSCLYLGFLYKAIEVFGKDNKTNILLLGFSFLSFFFFKSLGINIIRQGVSLSLLLLAVILHLKKEKITLPTIALIVVATGIHITTLVPAGFYFANYYFLRKVDIRYYLFLYVLFVGLAASGFSILSMGGWLEIFSFDERRLSYITKGNFDYATGFKPQFVAFNSIFLVLFMLARKLNTADDTLVLSGKYDVLIKTFILISCIFYLMFTIPFSDRWGVMSWVFIPFLLSPYFKVSDKNKSIFILLMLVGIFLFFNVLYEQN